MNLIGSSLLKNKKYIFYQYIIKLYIYISNIQKYITKCYNVIFPIYTIKNHKKCSLTTQQKITIFMLPFFCSFCIASEVVAMNGKQQTNPPSVSSHSSHDSTHQDNRSEYGNPGSRRSSFGNGGSAITTQPKPGQGAVPCGDSGAQAMQQDYGAHKELELCPPCDKTICKACMIGSGIGAGVAALGTMATFAGMYGCFCKDVGRLGLGAALAGGVMGSASTAAASCLHKHGCRKNTQYVMCDRNMGKTVGLGAVAGNICGGGLGATITGAATGCQCPTTGMVALGASGVGTVGGAALGACMYGVSKLCCQKKSSSGSEEDIEMQALRLSELTQVAGSNSPVMTQPQSTSNLHDEETPFPCDIRTCGKDPCSYCVSCSSLIGGNIGSAFGLGLGYYLCHKHLDLLGSALGSTGILLMGTGAGVYYCHKHGKKYVAPEDLVTSEEEKTECKNYCCTLSGKTALMASNCTASGSQVGMMASGCQCPQMLIGAAIGATAGCLCGITTGLLWQCFEDEQTSDEGLFHPCLKKMGVISTQPQKWTKQDNNALMKLSAASSGCGCVSGAAASASTIAVQNGGCLCPNVATGAALGACAGCATGATAACCGYCLYKYCHKPSEGEGVECVAMESLLDSSAPITTQPQRRPEGSCDGEEPGPSGMQHSGGSATPVAYSYCGKGTDDDTSDYEELIEHHSNSGADEDYEQKGGKDSSKSDSKSGQKGKGKGKGKRKSGDNSSSSFASSGGGKHGYRCYDSTGFLPGYSREGQISSLLTIQSLIVNSSEQVLSTLRFLSLKATAFTSHKNDFFYTQCDTVTMLRKNIHASSGSFPVAAIQQEMAALVYQPFGSVTSYTTNLEHKIRSGNCGVITNIAPKFSIGVAYHHNNEPQKEHIGIQINSAIGSVKTKSETDSVSVVVAWNTKEKGFTGHLVSCYGWGKVKNNRTIIYSDGQVNAKGKPDVTLNGGLAQFGYNIALGVCSITPYIENTISKVEWSPYSEKTGPVPCKISQNKEFIMEQSIGLRNQWELKGNAELHIWGAGISGKRNTHGLQSNPVVSLLPIYEASIPSYNKRYLRTELGVSYEKKVSDTFYVGLNGKTRFKNMKKTEGQQANVYLQYVY